ncbi:MAG: hypothetical protein AUK35_09655 [Zetaproteobacteria bacterium CG2_30_46_52]|nr:MAG: hypothetical protein AUK35_09655 [Zetaproteobacteria bacterium CG2_30_46_52]
MFKAKRMGIAVAVETMYGSDKLPTAALNAMLVENVKLGALDGDEIERPHVRPGSSGAFFKTLINKRVTLSFDVRLRGAGAAGGMPAIDPIMRAIGFAGFTVASTHRQYKLVSDGEESATVYLFRGGATAGIRHRLLGVRGAWKFTVSGKSDGILSVSLIGLYTDPTSHPMPADFNFTGFTAVPIPPVNKQNTTFTLGGYAAILEKLDIDSGIKAVHRPLVNYESVDITERAITGSITIQEPTLATKDFFSSAYGDPEVLVFENGLSAGQIIRIDGPRVQRLKPELGESEGIANLTIPLVFLPSDGGDDNDLKFTFK